MTAEQFIDECQIDGNVVVFPDVQLDRKTYQEVQKKLSGIGGKWSRKHKGFLFPSDPSKLLGRVQAGEEVNLKKDFQFFATPPEVCNEMQMYASIGKEDIVLEPSAGSGNLLNGIDRDIFTHYCELNPDMAADLQENFPEFRFMGHDFMETELNPIYTRIIANPPFTKNQYCAHIRRMYDLLAPGGRLVAIAPIGYTFASNGPQKKFREWLYDLDVAEHSLPKGTFKESGTMIETRILVFDK
jgi:type I restriction-modification system DNA methylase subunit